MSTGDSNKKRGRGRPKGSRNKSSLTRAQLTFDDAAELAANTLVALIENDKETLKITEDVPTTIRLQACKVVLDKAIANEKDKSPVTPEKEHKNEAKPLPKVALKAASK